MTIFGSSSNVLAEAWVEVKPETSNFSTQLSSDIETQLKNIGGGLTDKLTKGAAAMAGFTQFAANEFQGGAQTIREETGLTGEALEGLIEDMREVGGSGTQQSLTTIGDLIGDLNTRLGLTGEPLQEITTRLAQLADITGDDAAASVDGIIDLFQKWQVETEEQTGLLDYLFRASQASQTSVGDLASEALAARGVFSELGFSLRETIAFLAQMDQQGGNSTKVVSALRLGWARLTKDFRDPEEAFQRITRRIQEADSAAEAGRIGIEAFGSRSGPLLAAALRSGSLSVEDFTSQLNTGTETIAKAHEETQTLWDRVQALKNEFISFIGPGSQAAAVFFTIASGIGPTIQGAGELVGIFGDVRDEITGLRAAAALGGQSLSTMGAISELTSHRLAFLKSGAFIGTAGILGLVALLANSFIQTTSDAREEADSLAETLKSGLGGGADQARAAIRAFSTQLDEELLDIAPDGFWEGLTQFPRDVLPGIFGDDTLSLRLDEARQRVDELTDSAESQTGAQRRATLALAEYADAELRLQEIRNTTAVGDDRRAAASARVDEARRNAIGAAKTAALVESELGQAVAAAASEHRGASRAAERQADSYDELADRAKALRLAQLELVGGFTGIVASFSGLRDAQEAVADAQEKVNRLRRQGKTDTDKYHDAIVDLRGASADAVGEQAGLVQTVVEYLNTLPNVANAQKQAADLVRFYGEQAGLTKGQIEGMVDMVGRAIDKNKEFLNQQPMIGHVELRGVQKVLADIGDIVSAVKEIPGNLAVDTGGNGGGGGRGGNGGGGNNDGGYNGPTPLRAIPGVTAVEIDLDGKTIYEAADIVGRRRKVRFKGRDDG